MRVTDVDGTTVSVGPLVQYILSAGDAPERFAAANAATVATGDRAALLEALTVTAEVVGFDDDGRATLTAEVDGAERVFASRQADPSGRTPGTWRE